MSPQGGIRRPKERNLWQGEKTPESRRCEPHKKAKSTMYGLREMGRWAWGQPASPSSYSLQCKLGKLGQRSWLPKGVVHENAATAAAAAKSLQSCLTLCDPIDGSPPGSAIPGILQRRTPEWVAISFSNAWKWKVKVKSLSRVRLLATPWTAAYQAPPSMGFSKQEYWSGCHCLLRWKCWVWVNVPNRAWT